MEGLQESIAPISKFFYVVTNPRIIFDAIVNVSYWLAVLISITSLMFYISTKSEKSKQTLYGTILAYTLLRAIASVV